ncbi:MAG: carbohydrate binding domain-containing protein, partial [Fibrobacterales bacterium]
DIDEVRLWKDVRTASEIYYDHYNAYEDLNSTDNLVAYWDANQVSGTLLKDEVGGYTGTLTNMESGDWVTSWTRRTLTVASSANGSNNVDGAITVMDTKWFYINGTPDVGYVFTNWIDGGGGVVPVFSDAAAASSWVYISGGDGSILGSFDVDFDPGYVDNAQFNSGTTGWTNLTHSSGAQSFSVVGGEAVIAVTGTGGDGNRWNNNIMQEFSGTTEILVSTNYTVSFDIKANKASVDYHAQMYGHTSSTTSPSGALGGQSGTITTSWQTVSFTWSHGGAYNYKFLNIGFGGVDQAGLAPYTVYIDNVSIIAQ